MYTLYNGDCRPYMAAMPDKSVDVVVTDPPYGMGYYNDRSKTREPFARIIGDDRFPVEVIPELWRLARKAVLVFCRWNNLPEVPLPTSFIVWVKDNHTLGDARHTYGRKWEGILFYPQEEHEFQHRPQDVFTCRRVPSVDLVHPTQKPVPLLRWLIEANTKPGDVVLDPYMGSGSTGVACARSGRRFIGCEISPDYYAVAERRIKSAYSEPPLFVLTDNRGRDNGEQPSLLNPSQTDEEREK